MTIQEAESYILNIPKFTKKNKPEHTKLLLKYLGNPEQRLKVIHVAGTNGKGSVCAYLDAMLRAQGKTTGLFTSPHLVHMKERIAVNGSSVEDEVFVRVFETVKEASERMQESGWPHPTFFEFLFGMAVSAFAEAGVEYAVLETGLGGRLDATNSVEHPVCSVITSIGFDHTELLGDTLEEIAWEKAGIIKAGSPLVFADSDEKSSAVIENAAKKAGVLCNKIGKNAFKILEIEQKYIAFSCVNAYDETIIWRLRTTACYQPENAVLAIKVMELLFGDAGKPHLWKAALEQVVWQGRMEEVLSGIYIDGAHNISAVLKFAESVSKTETKGKLLLFSAVQDKNYEEMIACLCRNVDAEEYVVTRIEDKRAADTAELAETFRRYTEKPVLVIEPFHQAWSYLLKNKGDRTVYCLGSLYLAGMIKKMTEQEDS